MLKSLLLQAKYIIGSLGTLFVLRKRVDLQDREKAKFKVKITPEIRASQTALYNNMPCLYTISIGSHSIDMNAIVDGYRWASKTFPFCRVLLGDGLFKTTSQIIRRPDGEDAATVAKKQTSETLRRFKELAGGRKIKFVKTSNILSRLNFRPSQNEIEELYRINEIFADSINADAKQFVDRQLRNDRLGLPYDQAINYSIKYLKQEVAIYLYLARRGYLVDVYVGKEMSTLSKIMEKQITGGVPQPLVDRVNISLIPVRDKVEAQ